MALIWHPTEDHAYDLPMVVITDLARVGRTRGLQALITALEQYRPFQGDLRGRDPIRFADVPTPRAATNVADDLVETFRGFSKKTKKVEEEPVETLTTPVIPELNEDGTKKLFKTRYNELERKYIALHGRQQVVQRANDKLRSDNEKLIEQNYKYAIDTERLKALTVDGEKVNKMIDRLCKETGVVIVQDDFRGLSVDQRIERFLGTILCRIRTEVVADELAD